MLEMHPLYLGILFIMFVAAGVLVKNEKMDSVIRLLWVYGLAWVLIAGALLLQPWVRFDFILYADPNRLLELVPQDLPRSLFNKFGVPGVTAFLDLIKQVSSLNAIGLQLTPIGWPRLFVFLPIPILLFSGLGIVLRKARAAQVILSGGSLLFCCIGIVGLIAAAPEIDSLGIHSEFSWRLVMALLGVRLGNGLWWETLGLITLGIANLINLAGGDREIRDDSTYNEI